MLIKEHEDLNEKLATEVRDPNADEREVKRILKKRRKPGRADQTAVRDWTCRRFGYGQKKGTLFYERRRASLITVVSMKKFAQCL